VDSFTLVAQAINFLVLVVLLRRFLFGPLMRVMDEREQRFAQRRQEAEKLLTQARLEREEAHLQGQQVERTRAELLARAQVQADEHLHALLDQARREVTARREEWLEQERRDRVASLKALRPRLAALIGAVCRQALRDLADQDLEERMALSLARRLAGECDLPAPGPTQVFSSRPLGPQARTALERALGGFRLEYRIGSEDPPGVRVHAGGWELEWTVDSYLENLQERVVRLLEEEAGHAAP